MLEPIRLSEIDIKHPVTRIHGSLISDCVRVEDDAQQMGCGTIKTMKLERSHTLIIILLAVGLAIVGLVILLLPTKHVTGSTQSKLNPLSVIQSDGQSVGQSIQGNQLVPAPTNNTLQSPGDISALQATGALN